MIFTFKGTFFILRQKRINTKDSHFSARGLRASLGIACERGAFSSDISVKVTAGLFTRSNCDVFASWYSVVIIRFASLFV